MCYWVSSLGFVFLTEKILTRRDIYCCSSDGDLLCLLVSTDPLHNWVTVSPASVNRLLFAIFQNTNLDGWPFSLT